MISGKALFNSVLWSSDMASFYEQWSDSIFIAKILFLKELIGCLIGEKKLSQ